MGTFYEEGYREAAGFTQQQLDDIALKQAGRLGGIGGGYGLRGELPDPVHGYGFKWIATHGEGNRGIAILTPRCPRAAEYLRQGKVARFMRDFELTYQEADSLYSAGADVQYFLEEEVLAYCVATRDAWDAWQSDLPETWRQRARWEKKWGMPHWEGSFWRWASICTIMRRWTAA